MGEHSDRLAGGVDAWNQWRRGEGIARPDLSNHRLDGKDLEGPDFASVNFFQASLFEVALKKAKLDQADFFRADLRCTRLSDATGVRTSFRHADLRGAVLVDCDFRGGDFREARFRGAELYNCNFEGANLEEADFTEAVLSECRFAHARFGHTNLSGTRLWAAKGLDDTSHWGPSYLDPEAARTLPDGLSFFLRGLGWPDRLMEYWSDLTSDGISFYSCFISYSHADETFAHRLHDALQKAGVRCWLDRHQLLPGDDIKDQIDHGIRMWDKVVLCCSEDSLTSWWVDQEIEKALQKEERLWKERGEKVLALVPVRVDDYLFQSWESGKKSAVTGRFVGDFSEWEENDAKFRDQLEMLLRALRADSLARGIPPEPQL